MSLPTSDLSKWPNDSVWALKVPHANLSICRIAFFSFFIADYAQLYLNRACSFSSAHTVVGNVALPALLVVLVFVAAGCWMRSAALAGVLLTFIVQRYSQDSYHADAIYKQFMLIFAIAPRPRALAVDALKLPQNERGGFLPVWFVLTFFLGIALVYFDSIFFKMRSHVWTSGSAFWLSAGLPHFSTDLFPEWARNVTLVKGLSWLSLGLEMLFPLILLRRLRVPIAIVGFGLHFGIALLMPIPWFGLSMSALYLFFYPLFRQPATAAAASVPAAPKWCLLVPLTMVGLQFFLIGNRQWGMNPFVSKKIAKAVTRLANVLGLRNHPVYLDAPYLYGYRPLRFEGIDKNGKEFSVPTFSETSVAEVTGRYYCTMIAFARVDTSPFEKLYEEHWARYVKGWIAQEGIQCTEISITAHFIEGSVDVNFDDADRIKAEGFTSDGTMILHEHGGTETTWSAAFLQRLNEVRKDRM